MCPVYSLVTIEHLISYHVPPPGDGLPIFLDSISFTGSEHFLCEGVIYSFCGELSFFEESSQI